jgi:hypothetical protein
MKSSGMRELLSMDNSRKTQGRKDAEAQKTNFFATSRLGVSASEGLTDKIR